MADNTKDVRQRRYVSRDFAGLRTLLLEYARLNYADKIEDFSEASLGGLLLDLAAYVGDNLNFYLDHQFGELFHDTAVESKNIERNLRNVGVKITGASPATVDVEITIEVPAIDIDGLRQVDNTARPIVKAGTIFTAGNGVTFELINDVDFTYRLPDGTYAGIIATGRTITVNGVVKPKTFLIKLHGHCKSGTTVTETFSLGTFIPFRQITLENANVSEINTVIDDQGNIYYEVSSLTHDTIYRAELNTKNDSNTIREVLRPIPAPYRYTADVSLNDRTTTLTFGGGSAQTLSADSIPDPSQFAIPLPNNKIFSRVSVNPNELLQSKTLGVCQADTTLSITYRYGGGLFHNAPANTINAITTLITVFPFSPTPAVAADVRNTLSVTNPLPARGGEDPPTVNDLKVKIPSQRNSQERIVTREDLIARVYSMPSSFGRVFRTAVHPNPVNPLSTIVYLVSRDIDGNLTPCTDTLKENVQKYLNPYRMISDAVDILDAQVINLKLTFEVLVDTQINSTLAIQEILTNLESFFQVTNWEIDEPIILSDIQRIISQPQGIISITSLKFECLTGEVNNAIYSDVFFDVATNTTKGIIVPPPGGIFEIRNPELNIVGRTV